MIAIVALALLSQPSPAPVPSSSAAAALPSSSAAAPSTQWAARATRVRLSHGTGGLVGSDSATFDLRRQGDEFVGTAVWIVRMNGQAPVADSGTVHVPTVAVDSFLRAFAFAAPKPVPAVDDLRVVVKASDDYPWWSVELDGDDVCSAAGCVPGPVLRFESPASGERPAPWFRLSEGPASAVDGAPLLKGARILWALLGEEPLDAMWAIARHRARQSQPEQKK